MHPLKKKFHETLARYFMEKPLFFDPERMERPNARKCLEQPYQQTMAEMWDETAETLTDLWLVEAKIRCGGVKDLQDDYQNFLFRGEKVFADTKQQVRYFNNFLNSNYILLARGSSIKYFCIQQALNNSKDDPVSRKALEILKIVPDWIFFDEITKPESISEKPLLTLQIDSEITGNIDVKPDFSMIVGVSGEKLRFFNGHSSRAYKEIRLPYTGCEVYFFHDHKELAVSIKNRTESHLCEGICFYDAETEKIIGKIDFPPGENFRYFDISEDGRYVALKSKDNDVKVYETGSWKIISRIRTSHTNNFDIDFFKGKKLLLLFDTGCIVESTSSGSVFRYNIRDPGNVTRWPGLFFKVSHDARHILVTGKTPPSLTFYDFQTGSKIREIETGDIFIRALDINDAAGTFVVHDSCELKIYDIQNGEPVRNIPVDGYFCNRFDLIKFCENTEELITLDGGQIKIWNLESKETYRSLCGHQAPFIVNTEIMAKNCYMGAVREKAGNTCVLYDLSDNSYQMMDSKIYDRSFEDLVLAENKKYLLEYVRTGDIRQIRIRLWNLEKMTAVSEMNYPSVLSGSGFFNSSGDTCAIHFSKESNHYDTMMAFDTEDGSCIYESHTATEEIRIQYFSHDGKYLYVLVGKSLIKTDISLKDREKVFEFDTYSLKRLALSPCGSYLGAAEYSFENDCKNSGCFSVVENDSREKVFQCAINKYSKILFSKNGRYLLVGSDPLAVVSLKTMKIIFRYDGDSKKVKDFHLSADSGKLLIRTVDELIVYDIPSGKRIVCIELQKIWDIVPENPYCNFLPDSGYILLITRDDYAYEDKYRTAIVFDCMTGKINGRILFSKSFSTIKYNETTFSIDFRNDVRIFQYLRQNKSIKDAPMSFQSATGVRLWHRSSSGGGWDENIMYLCEWCGSRIIVPPGIIDTIREIHYESHVGPDDSPCLKLPDEAWEDARLLGECPNCGGKLKFNPFVVDNRDRF